jgi:N-dimethylarginine dimethylaminohydrolase
LGAGVSSEYGRLRRVLLCPPTHQQWTPITTLAKANLAAGKVFDREKAIHEHAGFAKFIQDRGVEVVWVEAGPGLGVQVFTRDLGSGHPDGVLLGRFKYDSRRQEMPLTREALAKAGISVVGEVAKGVLEGGDFHYLEPGLVVVGRAERTDDEGIDDAARYLPGWEIVRMSVPKEFHHSDCVFVVIGERLCVACLEALEPRFRMFLRERKFTIIDVPLGESRKVGSNMVALDPGTILSHRSSHLVNERLRALGFEVLEADLEMISGQGGGPRCLTFPLERDKV